eukprot:1159545-Pelagomonas_calceolata.AAC.3
MDNYLESESVVETGGLSYWHVNVVAESRGWPCALHLKIKKGKKVPKRKEGARESQKGCGRPHLHTRT